MKATDKEIMLALIGQVTKAARGKPETEVTTFITRPMWRAFLRATGTNQNLAPTQWQGKGTVRVFGSKTIVLEQRGMASISFCIEVQKHKRTTQPKDDEG